MGDIIILLQKMENKIKITIKLITNDFSIEVEKTGTILDIKKAIKEQTKTEECNQKLIFRGSSGKFILGKILKDEETIEQHHIESGCSLHLAVKKPQAAPKPGEANATTANPSANTGANPQPAGMPGMGFAGFGFPGMRMPGAPGAGVPGAGAFGMGVNPDFISAQMQAFLSNPAFIQSLQNNPMIAQMAQNNPRLQLLLSNPEMVRTIMTPENIRMATTMIQSMGGLPGAFPFFGGGMGMGMPGAPGAAAPNSGINPAATNPVPNQAPSTTNPAPSESNSAPNPAPSTTNPAPPTANPAPSTTNPVPSAPTANPAPSTTNPTTSAPNVTASTSSNSGAVPGAVPGTVPGAAPGAVPGAMFGPFPFPNFAQSAQFYGPYMWMGGMPQMPGMAGVPPQPAASAAPTAPAVPVAPVDPKVKYAAQLQQMKEMGFTNEEVNIESLKTANGNVEIAVERLLTMMN